MGFTESIRTCLKNYAKFDGRARRSEFWWFYLFNQIVAGIPMFFGVLLVFIGSVQESTGLVVLGGLLMLVGAAIGLALITPSLAVGCRRLHDRGMSGWFQLLLLLSLANLVVVVFWALPGNPGDNVYGPEPA